VLQFLGGAAVKSLSLLVYAGFFSLVGFGCANSGPGQRGEFLNGTSGTDDIGLTGSGSGSGGSDSTTGGTGGSLGNIKPGGSGDGSSDCGSTLQVTFRDFTEKHPDFEMAFKGDVVRRTLLNPTLGTDHKPVFRNSLGCPFKSGTPLDCDNWMPTVPVIQSADSFHSWYNTTAGTNIELPKTIPLVETPAGSGTFVYDSSAFFPLSPTEGFGVSPMNGDNPDKKNFLFTTEVHVRFGYVAGQKFVFRGDDDLWIFVNGKLALDLGSLHNAEEGTIDFDAQAAALGIAPGTTYPMDIFHAERHTTASNFRVSTNISCFEPVDIAR
jgi:fibro-slime domain-containing protein